MMKPKQEFYTTNASGQEEALIVVKTVKYPAGDAVTVLRRGVDGRMAGGSQIMLADLENELADELCGSITDSPVAEQKALVGKLAPEMNVYFQ